MSISPDSPLAIPEITIFKKLVVSSRRDAILDLNFTNSAKSRTIGGQILQNFLSYLREVHLNEIFCRNRVSSFIRINTGYEILSRRDVIMAF
jgi:hypothetical protein